MVQKRPDIPERVASNETRTRRVQSQSFEVGEGGRKTLSFGQNTVSVSVEAVEVEQRDVGNTLLSGSPNAENGSGRGVSGDRRGGYTLVEDTPEDTVWTKDGRNVIRDKVDGQNAEIAEAGVGSGGRSAGKFEPALDEETGRAVAWADYSAGDYSENEFTAGFRFQDTEASVQEFGLFSADGRLSARVVVPELTPAPGTVEFRVTIRLSVSGDGGPRGVFTTDGIGDIAKFIGERTAVGLKTIRLGTGTDSFDPSDFELTSPEFGRTASRTLSSEGIDLTIGLFNFEPQGQLPIEFSEVAVETTAGTMLWATTFGPEEKTASQTFEVGVSFSFS